MQRTWMLIHMELGDRKLDFYALQDAFSVRLNPIVHVMTRKRLGVVADLLDDSPPRRRGAPSSLRAPPVYVEPKSSPFLYQSGENGGEDEEGGGDDFAEHEFGFGETTFATLARAGSRTTRTSAATTRSSRPSPQRPARTSARFSLPARRARRPASSRRRTGCS